jgi:hypothetical protein
MKLSSPHGKNIIKWTKDTHGSAQGFCAWDSSWTGCSQLDKTCYAPCDGFISDQYTAADGDTHFHYNGNGFYLEFIHVKWDRLGWFKRGERIGEWNGKTAEPHFHWALYFKGWRWPQDALDRSINMFWWTCGNKKNWQANWENYPGNIELPEFNSVINTTPMIKPTFADKLYKLTSTNTVTFHIRLEPKKDSVDLGNVPSGFTWLSNMFALTTDKDYPKWWSIIIPSGDHVGELGWVAANWIKEEVVLDDTQCKTDLNNANIKVKQLEDELNSWEPKTIMIKKI